MKIYEERKEIKNNEINYKQIVSKLQNDINVLAKIVTSLVKEVDTIKNSKPKFVTGNIVANTDFKPPNSIEDLNKAPITNAGDLIRKAGLIDVNSITTGTNTAATIPTINQNATYATNIPITHTDAPSNLTSEEVEQMSNDAEIANLTKLIRVSDNEKIKIAEKQTAMVSKMMR